MGNARVYKTPDPESPDPNNLQLMPTEALISEILRRHVDGVVVVRYNRERPVIHYWEDTELPTHAILEYALDKMRNDW